jgi:hypothetical protein
MLRCATLLRARPRLLYHALPKRQQNQGQRPQSSLIGVDALASTREKHSVVYDDGDIRSHRSPYPRSPVFSHSKVPFVLFILFRSRAAGDIDHSDSICYDKKKE